MDLKMPRLQASGEPASGCWQQQQAAYCIQSNTAHYTMRILDQCTVK